VEREAVELIATSAALVTSRLHGAIIAATQGTPVVLVDYQDKMRGVAQMLGAPVLRFAELGDLAKSVDKLLDDAAAPPDVTRPAAYGALTARVLNFLTR
jgi:polysaccharide pyruvyl transferase WcaK-like protein